MKPEYREICELAALTGYRIDDLLKVRVYQARGDRLNLREAKTGKSRSVELTARARALLAKRSAGKNSLSYLFRSPTKKITQKRQKIHRTTIYRNFSAAVRKAGLDGNGYTVHSLRKVYARDLLARTHSIRAVQRDLNHDSLATTLLYVTDVE